MEKYSFFLILTCMTCLSYISCEKTGIQYNHTDNLPLELRRGDCEECPGVDECCCGVSLDGDATNATIRLCGTSDGAGACAGSDTCGNSFSGGGQQIVLNSISNPKQAFCMLEGSPFWIYNAGTGNAEIVITCQGDLTVPQLIQLHLSPGDSIYYETNGSCLLSECD